MKSIDRFGVPLRQIIHIGFLLDCFRAIHQQSRIHVDAVRNSEVLVETPARWQIFFRQAKMPFADRAGLVSFGLQHVGKRYFVKIQAVDIFGEKNARHSNTSGITAG